MSVDELPDSIKIKPSQRHAGYVYIMAFHETVSPEMALKIAAEIIRVANEAKAKTETLSFAAPIVDDDDPREVEARVRRYGSTMHAKDSEEYERIKPLYRPGQDGA